MSRWHVTSGQFFDAMIVSGRGGASQSAVSLLRLWVNHATGACSASGETGRAIRYVIRALIVILPQWIARSVHGARPLHRSLFLAAVCPVSSPIWVRFTPLPSIIALSVY